MFSFCRTAWSREAGYREFLALAFPLILSTGSWSIQHFVNRMFLTWYSPEAIAAAMPAGMLSFAVSCIFLGTVSYVDVFIAQYYGAGRHKMIGPSLWQGIYVAMIGAAALLAFVPLAGPIFRLVGHAPEVRVLETVYFQLLCLAALPSLVCSAMSGFYAGRGKTWTLVLVNSLGMGVNVVLDYVLIFGRGAFPEMGIRGAGIATLLSSVFMMLLYFALVSGRKNDEAYHTRRGWRINGPLLKRLIRFGLPSGMHFFLDIAGFTAFILIMGTLGTVSLAATNIAFNISTLAFMPMLGCSIAASVLTGQYLGRNRPELAERSVYSGFQITFAYMLAMSALYVLTPGIFLSAYASHADPARFAEIREIVLVLLRFVAVYSLFDAMNIIFAAAIKGAGDTHFVMRIIVVVSLCVLVAPSYVVLVVLHGGIYAGWAVASAYIAALGLSFLFRFLNGKWKTMRVIEPVVPVVTPILPEAPVQEL